MRGRLEAGRGGGAVAATLALVLLFRLLIPAGYMVGPDRSGRPVLVLCEAAAEPIAAPDPHQGHRPGHEAPSQAAEPPCPYAALAAPVLPPSPPTAAESAPSAEPTPQAEPTVAALPPALAAPPPPARGPPPSV